MSISISSGRELKFHCSRTRTKIPFTVQRKRSYFHISICVKSINLSSIFNVFHCKCQSVYNVYIPSPNTDARARTHTHAVTCLGVSCQNSFNTFYAFVCICFHLQFKYWRKMRNLFPRHQNWVICHIFVYSVVRLKLMGLMNAYTRFQTEQPAISSLPLPGSSARKIAVGMFIHKNDDGSGSYFSIPMMELSVLGVGKHIRQTRQICFVMYILFLYFIQSKRSKYEYISIWIATLYRICEICTKQILLTYAYIDIQFYAARNHINLPSMPSLTLPHTHTHPTSHARNSIDGNCKVQCQFDSLNGA